MTEAASGSVLGADVGSELRSVADSELPPLPDFASGTLSDLMPAVAAGMGVALRRDDGSGATLGLAPADRVAVLLVDGLGAQALAEHAALAPTLAALSGRTIAAGFPSTTAVSIGSLGCGRSPGEHGLVGTIFAVPEWGALLAPLRWGDEPNPVATQPEPTAFERLAAAGVRTSAVGAAKYEHSGLTRAVLRGARYVAADDAVELAAATAEVLSGPGRAVAYTYWSELDLLGHVHGPGSAEWLAGLAVVDDLVAGIIDRLPDGALLHVTADHGMVDCGAEQVIDIDADSVLLAGVLALGGEPRARHVYAEPGAASDVLAAWRERLADAAWVVSRDEAVARGWFGTVDPDLLDRIGDVVVAARSGYRLAAGVDARLSALRGQHGSLTATELEIPLLTWGGNG